MTRLLSRARLFGAVLALSAALAPAATAQLAAQLKTIRMPEGFEISLYADEIPNARSMVRGDNGVLFVSSRTAGNVYALVDTDNDYRIDTKYTVLDASKPLPDGAKVVMPNGVAFRDGSLYIATVSHILRLDNIESRLDNPPAPVIVNAGYPTESHHGWKFIAFGPDGKLYVPVGAPCNVCEPPTDLHASITRINPDGTGRETVARGVRQSVGFDWHPQTRELWFTDNGGDMMGDDFPTDELNRITAPGQHFGYPYVHQGDTLDQRFGAGRSVAEFQKPAMKLGPHVAALGMEFYTGQMFPAEYRNQIFIAEHGSWNRSKKLGYRITLVRLEGSEAKSYEVFAEGWLQGQNVWGRPVDILVLPDGSMLVSDDRANAIYRISYKS